MVGNDLVARCVGAHEDDATANGEVLVGFAGNEELATCVDAKDAIELLLCGPALVILVAELGVRIQQLSSRLTSVTSSRWPKDITPELEHTMSMFPKCSLAWVKRLAIWLTSLMFALIATAPTPNFLM